MITYFIVLMLLWGMYLLVVIEGRRLLAVEYTALVLFIVFAGLRFETGNDWLIYREAYDELPDLFRDDISRTEWISFEPFYVALALLLKGFLSFQWATALIVTFTGGVLYWFCRKLETSFACVFAVYFPWVYLALQMAAIRHSIAVSLVLVSVYAILQRKRTVALALMVVAAGFHVSAVLFFPLLVLVTGAPNYRKAFVLVTTSSVAFFLLFTTTQLGLLSWIPFYEKVQLYVSSSEGAAISVGALGYIAINVCILFMSGSGARTPVSLLSFWGTAYLLVFQVGVWFMPIFWNRVMAVVVVFQACFIYERVMRTKSYGLFFATMVLSGLALYKQLWDPAAVAYIPYQNYVWEQVFRSGEGDGERRFFEALEIHQERNVR